MFGRYSFEEKDIKNLKPCYLVDFEEGVRYIKQILSKEDIEYIEETLKIKSIDNYFPKMFLKNHEKMYLNRPIYFSKSENETM